MEALLPTLVAVLLAELSGRAQAETLLLARHYRSSSAVLQALVLASFAGAGFAAAGGILVAAQLTYQARTLLLGVALVFAAVSMFWPMRAPAAPRKGAAFSVSLWRIGKAIFAGNGLFLIFAFAARGNAPVMAACAGAAGLILAGAPALILEDEWAGMTRKPYLRWATALILLLAGLYAGLSALGLLGFAN